MLAWRLSWLKNFPEKAPELWAYQTTIGKASHHYILYNYIELFSGVENVVKKLELRLEIILVIPNCTNSFS